MWYYNEEVFELPEDASPKTVYGFVYLITHKESGKKYIGKKFFWSQRTKTVKGKKKRIKVESDWKDYYGSNKYLNEERELIGNDAYKREILHLCTNKAECAYLELVEQVERKVLLSDEYYNGFIGTKCGPKGLNRLRML